MEPVEVVVRFDRQGKVLPQSFIWRQQEYMVTSMGRRWQDDQGQHILVMTPDERVNELVYVPGEMRWYLKRLDRGHRMA